MTKKKTVIPKKKAIKKPKFIKYFALWLAIFMAISMVVSYFVIEVYRQQAKTAALTKWNSYTQELSKLMNDYYTTKDNEDFGEEYLSRVKAFLFRYAEEMDEYCAVYIDNEKIFETPAGAYAAVTVTLEEKTVYNYEIVEEDYFLEDQSYLLPLYREYKIDPAKDAWLNDVYSVENTTLKDLAEKIGLMPKMYTLCFDTIYINKATHTFIPGKVSIINKADLETIGEFDCTPDDTKGYRLIDESKEGMEINNPYHGYLYPSITDISQADVINNETADISYDDVGSVFSWEILTTPSEIFCNKACFKELPLTTAAVLTVACLISLLLAVTVSTILYSNKKTVWEIFEYRKKTTAAMAHDLKTPLAAMSAYAENLEYDIDSEKRAYYSSKVRENVAFMNKTIESILMFTKSEAGTAKSVASDIDVHALIEDEYNAVAELFEKKNIKVDIKGDGHVKSNKELVEQAVRNLIGNAAKYTRPDTTLDISIDNKGFKMSNLTDQKIKNVNDLKKPFVKGEESRGTESGAGLGLSIVENCLASAGHSLDIGFENETFKAVVRW